MRFRKGDSMEQNREPNRILEVCTLGQICYGDYTVDVDSDYIKEEIIPDIRNGEKLGSDGVYEEAVDLAGLRADIDFISSPLAWARSTKRLTEILLRATQVLDELQGEIRWLKRFV